MLSNISNYDKIIFCVISGPKKIDAQSQKSFAKWLLGSAENVSREYQTYDGWYNNPWNPNLGSTGKFF